MSNSITISIENKLVGIDNQGAVYIPQKMVKIGSNDLDTGELYEKYSVKNEIKDKILYFHKKEEIEEGQKVHNTYLLVNHQDVDPLKNWDDVNDVTHLSDVLDEMQPKNLRRAINRAYGTHRREGNKFADTVRNDIIEEYVLSGKTEDARQKTRRIAKKVQDVEYFLRDGSWGTAKGELENLVPDADFDQTKKDKYLGVINKYMTDNDI